MKLLLKLLHFLVFIITSQLQAQQTQTVNFTRIAANITITPLDKVVSGSVEVSFTMLKNTDTVYLDAVNMDVLETTNANLAIKTVATDNKILLIHDFKRGKNYTHAFTYQAFPKKAMYFIGWEYSDAKKQVWTQGQGKYTSNWLPSIDDMNDKIEFDLSITFHKEYQVIANGKLLKTQTQNELTTWYYNMQQPMSSYLVALAIGKYNKQEILAKSGVPITLYYYPEDSLKVEPTYRYTQQIFNYLEKRIGVSYPWQNYKQVPVKDFLYAGMENTSATIFSDSYVIDSTAFIDRNYVNVNAHELAHQWFGNLVTEESATHHWLHEGFATFYALQAEKELFGTDYYYYKLNTEAQKLVALSEEGKGESLLDPKASSLTFYQKGALVLHVLQEQIGERKFDKAVKRFLKKYAFKNATVDHLLAEIESVSNINISVFKKKWLESKSLPKEEIVKLLEENKSISQVNICKAQGVDFYWSNQSVNHKQNILQLNSLHAIASQIIKNLNATSLTTKEDILKHAFASNNVKTRQLIALHLDTIPQQFKKDFISLLNDKSYITQEAALVKLWLQYPAERSQFLNTTKGIIGFNNKNVRLLWLTLALVTPDFEAKNKEGYYNELTSYTHERYHFEVRQLAFGYLFQVQGLTSQNLKHLVAACKHPVWQFSKSSKKLLETLLKDTGYNARFQQIFSELSEEQQTFLQQYLDR